MNISFIGGGNMATALIGGLVAKGADAAATSASSSRSPAQRRKLVARFPASASSARPLRGAIDGADLVVLAVKPQQMRDAAQALAPFVAVVPVVMIDRRRHAHRRPVALAGRLCAHRARDAQYAGTGRRGISGAYAAPRGRRGGRKLATHVLEAAGAVLWVEREDMLDAVTGVSGSGPAYVFYFLEGLDQAALELGFARADARQLAYATFAGAIKLATASDLDPGVLRAQVTSKGGTTERAIDVLEAEGVKAKFVAAVKAARARANWRRTRESSGRPASDDPERPTQESL